MLVKVLTGYQFPVSLSEYGDCSSCQFYSKRFSTEACGGESTYPKKGLRDPGPNAENQGLAGSNLKAQSKVQVPAIEGNYCKGFCQVLLVFANLDP